MKLRIHGNSLRLRLNQSEVAQFSKTGFYEDTIEFAPGSSFSYVLECARGLEAPQAVYGNGVLQIRVPFSEGNAWATGDGVGISAEQPLESGKRLSILIEKDFRCIHSDEKDAEAYPNPLQDAGCKS